MQNNKTYSAKESEVERKWFIVDAEGKTLGRLATRIAIILRGKHKPMFTPHVDCGDFVIVINVEKIAVTGNRMDEKMYYHHSGYPGGLSTKSMREVIGGKFPERVLEQAVRKMLPKNDLSKQVMRKLKLYKGSEHPHEAQKPEELELR